MISMPSQIPPAIQGQKYISLTTFRKTGAALSTPVWFGKEDGKLYVMTLSKMGKTKRIRNNSQVKVAPCTMREKSRDRISPQSRACSLRRVQTCEEADRPEVFAGRDVAILSGPTPSLRSPFLSPAVRCNGSREALAGSTAEIHPGARGLFRVGSKPLPVALVNRFNSVIYNLYYQLLT